MAASIYDFSPTVNSDDSDYVPNSDTEEEDDILLIPEDGPKKNIIIRDLIKNDKIQSSEKDYSKNSIAISFINRENGDRKRKFDKRQSCYYCGKLHSKISQHYVVCHPTEQLVAEILKYPPGMSKNELMEKLRHLGNYHHNLKVIEENSGSLIVVRRPTHKVSYSDFLPCVHCLGFFKKIELYKHTPNCKFN